MRLFFFFPLVLFAGCNTPPLGFAGVPATQIDVERSTFDVRIKGDKAHALRVNAEFASNLAAVAPRAKIAIEEVSGCQIIPGTLNGDQIFITAALSC